MPRSGERRGEQGRGAKEEPSRAPTSRSRAASGVCGVALPLATCRCMNERDGSRGIRCGSKTSERQRSRCARPRGPSRRTAATASRTRLVRAGRATQSRRPRLDEAFDEPPRARRAGAGRSSGRTARRRACARHAVGAQCTESHCARRVLLGLIDARARRCRSTAAARPNAVCEPRWARAALSRRRPLQRGSVQLQGVLQTGARAALVVLCPRTQLGSAAARRGGRCGRPCRARRGRVARDACRRG